MSRDIPIIFSAPMISALFAGRKTMTRRLAFGDPVGPISEDHYDELTAEGWRVSGADDVGCCIAWPPTEWRKVKPGDQLWVRETVWHWGRWYRDGKTKTGRDRWRFDAEPHSATGAEYIPIVYQAPGGPPTPREELGFHKRPAIFLPREHSRLTLPVASTKTERLTAISEEDAWAEGVCVFAEGQDKVGWGDLGVDDRRALVTNIYGSARKAFNHLFDSLHGPEVWNANPEVVAMSFRVIKANIDSPEARAA